MNSGSKTFLPPRKTVEISEIRLRLAPDYHVGGAELNRDARRAASRMARRGRAPYQIQVRNFANLLLAHCL